MAGERGPIPKREDSAFCGRGMFRGGFGGREQMMAGAYIQAGRNHMKQTTMMMTVETTISDVMMLSFMAASFLFSIPKAAYTVCRDFSVKTSTSGM